MAKRRLNKKVALVGSAILAVVLLAVILLLLRMKDPEEFVRDADVAIAKQDYKKAGASLRAAYGSAKTDEFREEVLFKLADVYMATDEWLRVRGCWEEIVRVNSHNAKARYSELLYYYILGDSAATSGIWAQVQKKASDFLDVAERANLMGEQTQQWEIFRDDLEEPIGQRLGAFIYLIRGRANLEMTIRGTATNRDESLDAATKDLEKAMDLEPENINVYRYLAEASLERRRMLRERGSYAASDKLGDEAKAILEHAVEIAVDNPISHINLLRLKLDMAKSGSQAREEIKALEPEFQALITKFPSSAEAFREVAVYYSDCSAIADPELGLKYLDKSVEAAEKAMALDAKSAEYALSAANLYYRKYSLYKDTKNVIKAVDIAKCALTLPGAQDTEGPRKYANMITKYTLHSFLAHCSIEQILDSSGQLSEDESKRWLLEAETAVHAIEQIQTSEENPQVIQWRGMLNLAKGNRKTAVEELYTAYERLRALKPASPPWAPDLRFGYLCHRLAKVLKDSSEDGVVLKLLTDALNSYVATIKPEARLDYAEVGLKFNQWTAVRENIDVFEQRFGVTQRSSLLRIKSDIGAGRFDVASEALAARDGNDPNTVKLTLQLLQAKIRQLQMAMAQKERQDNLSIITDKVEDSNGSVGENTSVEAIAVGLKELRDAEAQLVEKLLRIDAHSVNKSDVISACRFHVEQGRLNDAKSLIDRFLQNAGDDTIALAYQATLLEPDPANIPEDRYQEIYYKVLSGISDPVRRALEFGAYYLGKKEDDKAGQEFQKVLDAPIVEKANPQALIFEQPELVKLRRTAAGYLFDIALKAEDYSKAEQIVQLAKSEDLDSCKGQVFAARLAMVKKDFEDALVRINDCLSQRPVFSRAYMLRGNINAALGKSEDTVLEDMHRASSLNPLNGIIAKGLANAIYRRNLKLGENVTSTHIVEARKSLEIAISLNPRDVELLDLYANFVAPTEPLRAVAILQDLLKVSPSMSHALQLGKLATETAQKENDAKLRSVLFDVAGAAFEQAKQIDPKEQMMLHLYAQYFRAKGDDKKAEQLLTDSQSELLLWNHYLQRGQYEQAKTILDQQYKSDPKNRTVIGGLLLVSEKTKDTDGVKKYTAELIALDPGNTESYLIEIQSYLKAGLIQETERKLQSFTEKFPDEPRTLLLSAWLSMRKGQLEKAVQLVNRNIEIDQDNPAAWRLRGEIRFFMADFSQAISDLKKSKALLDEPETRVSLARAFLQQRLYEDAITELKNTIDAPGAPPESRTLLEHVYTRLGRKDALSKLYEKTLERYPENVQWLNRAGGFAISIGQFEKAEILYEKACRLKRAEYVSPDTRELVNDSLYLAAFDGYLRALVAGAGTRGSATWNPKKLDKVFESARDYINSGLAPIVYFRMAQAKLALGDRETAVDYCHKSVDAAEHNQTMASEVLLRMYFLLGAEEVSKYCEEKLKADPSSLPANYTMFNLAKISGEYKKALLYIDKCIVLSDQGGKERVNFMVKKAEVLTLAYERSSDKKYLGMAITEYESLFAKMPNNTSVLNNLAYMLADNNERLPRALEYAEKAVELKPNDPSVLDTYAYVLHKNGKNSEALEKLAFAIQQYEQNNAVAPAEVYEHLGMVREASGAKQEALTAYKDALEIGGQQLSDSIKQRLTKAIERLSR